VSFARYIAGHVDETARSPKEDPVAKRVPPRRDKTVLVRLSEREQQNLQRAADEAGVPISELIRYGLRVAIGPMRPEREQ
jgi:hypothetical protein